MTDEVAVALDPPVLSGLSALVSSSDLSWVVLRAGSAVCRSSDSGATWEHLCGPNPVGYLSISDSGEVFSVSGIGYDRVWIDALGRAVQTGVSTYVYDSLDRIVGDGTDTLGNAGFEISVEGDICQYICSFLD